ncbi:hypothetical protein ACQPZQ_14860 [Pseudonocardia sp. CA-142604]|uniref:hypothetical protein n=1 Tax=Pseudonocardia sp. CA-142604 TaxID=3240024 RepID=UPI003D8E192F
MSDHPTVEPAATVRLRADEWANAAEITAAFVDLICADHELLRAEFNAIIAANLPDAAGDQQRLAPARTVTTVTGPLPPHRRRALAAAHSRRDSCDRPQNLRARQRGPPVRAPHRSDSVDPRQAEEVVGLSIDTRRDNECNQLARPASDEAPPGSAPERGHRADEESNHRRRVHEQTPSVLRSPLDRTYSADDTFRPVGNELERHRDGDRSRQTGG